MFFSLYAGWPDTYNPLLRNYLTIGLAVLYYFLTSTMILTCRIYLKR